MSSTAMSEENGSLNEPTRTGGDQLDMWWRTTHGLRKRDGEWQVTHSHTSVPFDMETSKASLDLEP